MASSIIWIAVLSLLAMLVLSDEFKSKMTPAKDIFDAFMTAFPETPEKSLQRQKMIISLPQGLKNLSPLDIQKSAKSFSESSLMNQVKNFMRQADSASDSPEDVRQSDSLEDDRPEYLKRRCLEQCLIRCTEESCHLVCQVRCQPVKLNTEEDPFDTSDQILHTSSFSVDPIYTWDVRN